MKTEALIKVLETANFTPKLVSSGTELTIACPLCWDEKQRLYVSTTSGLWYCFSCNAKGNLIALLMELCGLKTNEAFVTGKSIQGKEQRNLPIIEKRKDSFSALVDEVTLPLEFIPIDASPFPDSISMGLRYLQSRGISKEIALRYGVGYCLMGKYSLRVIVPVYTEGVLKTFVARSWMNNPIKKVLMPKDSKASGALFNHVNLDGYNPAILVEGVFDALKLIPTIPNVVATLGAHITVDQRILLKRKGYSDVILLRDGDTAGLEASIKEARLLKTAMMNVRIAILPDGKDPNSATLEEVYTALNNAKLIEKDLGVESLREVLENGY